MLSFCVLSTRTRLRHHSVVPVIASETCLSEESRTRLRHHSVVSVIAFETCFRCIWGRRVLSTPSCDQREQTTQSALALDLREPEISQEPLRQSFLETTIPFQNCVRALRGLRHGEQEARNVCSGATEISENQRSYKSLLSRQFLGHLSVAELCACSLWTQGLRNELTG